MIIDMPTAIENQLNKVKSRTRIGNPYPRTPIRETGFFSVDLLRGGPIMLAMIATTGTKIHSRAHVAKKREKKK